MNKKQKKETIEEIREYGDGSPIELDTELPSRYNQLTEQRIIVRAYNECGHCCTEIDLLDLIAWIKKNKPNLLND